MILIQFSPQPDITAYELAVIYGSVIMPKTPLFFAPIQCPQESWDQMHEGIKRHWTVVKPS